MGNIALVLFCLLTIGYVYWETGTYPHTDDLSMDAGLYPRFLIVILLLLAVALACRAFKERVRTGTFTIKNKPSLIATLLLGAMVAYCVLLGIAGYALATTAFVFSVSLMFRGTPKEGLIVGVGITTLLLALFRFGFQVPLPGGMLNLF